MFLCTFCIALLLGCSHFSFCRAGESRPLSNVSSTRYEPQDFSYLIGMAGFSEKALRMHFKLYEGYVTHTNLLLQTFNQYLSAGKTRTPEFQELKRRLGWEYNGMRLHELYFGNLGGKEPLSKEHPFAKQIADQFGSYEAWERDFIETGMLRGVGWVVLYQDPISKKLMNSWIGEHDIGVLAQSIPLLVMDVWEHAYMPDYATERMDYIKAFFKNIDWATISRRYEASRSN